MQIYAASSWRNTTQPEIVQALKRNGYNVYDFRHPEPGNSGFSWKQVATEYELVQLNIFRDRILKHPIDEHTIVRVVRYFP